MSLYVLKLRGHNDGDLYSYECQSHRTGFSLVVNKTFESEAEMIEIINGILSTSSRGDVRNVLAEIRADWKVYRELELTDRQAESIGWTSNKQQ
jgi:hypothetical protein